MAKVRKPEVGREYFFVNGQLYDRLGGARQAARMMHSYDKRLWRVRCVEVFRYGYRLEGLEMIDDLSGTAFPGRCGA